MFRDGVLREGRGLIYVRTNILFLNFFLWFKNNLMLGSTRHFVFILASCSYNKPSEKVGNEAKDLRIIILNLFTFA